jgi:hypothetical protein
MVGAFIVLRPVERIEAPLVETSSSFPPQGLNLEAPPLFGHADLQRAYEPDPHIVAASAGGSVDTITLNLDCGFVSREPTYGFKLFGGASENFLRVYFVATDGSDTTLVMRTPSGEWVCMQDSFQKMDPVIDIKFAPSGEYLIWVGMEAAGTTGKGSLYITQSPANKP